MPHKKGIAAALVLLGILVLIIGLRHGGEDKSARHVGALAPVTDLPVLTQADTRFTTASWKGRPYIVNFFASWCVDCRAEHEELMTLAASNIPIIGITFKDHADKALAYLGKSGNPFIAVADDTDGRAAIDWGVSSVPETFIVDGRGIVRWHHSGHLTGDIVEDELMPAWENAAHGENLR